jgi:hypothetical protein
MCTQPPLTILPTKIEIFQSFTTFILASEKRNKKRKEEIKKKPKKLSTIKTFYKIQYKSDGPHPLSHSSSNTLFSRFPTALALPSYLLQKK